MEKRVSKRAKVVLENKEEKVELELKGVVKFEFKNAPFHKDGQVEEISAEMATRFVKKGYGKVCND
jgi:hypothetical protein